MTNQSNKQIDNGTDTVYKKRNELRSLAVPERETEKRFVKYLLK